MSGSRRMLINQSHEPLPKGGTKGGKGQVASPALPPQALARVQG